MHAADLAAYLARIGLDRAPPPTADGLALLHTKHTEAIPFENIDVLLHRPIRLDPDSLVAKLVRARRGGYCFEQNSLFAAVLEAIGFRVARLAARVRFRATRLTPRTHMLLAVETDDGPWLADVGFGGDGLHRPHPMVPLRDVPQAGRTYRLVEAADTRVLQARYPDGWGDLYAFTPEPQEAVDYELANYYVSTHPESPFTRTLTVQRVTADARYVLRNREFTTDRGGVAETRTLTDYDLPRVLAETFGLAVQPGTRFPDRPWGT
jgi:N-hydroxyarylamine O-acetyltransferase